jgi:hypothetical protein
MTLTLYRFPIVAAALLVMSALSPAPTEAAVRQCMQPVTSEIIPAPNDRLGRQMALRSWSDKTRRQHGTPFTSWRVATKKVLGCRPATDGSAAFQCVAYAAPCKIEQVPGRRPPNRRRINPGEAIET